MNYGGGMSSTGVAFPDPNAVIIQEVVQLKWSIFQNFQFLVSEIEKIGQYIIDKPKSYQNSHSGYKDEESKEENISDGRKFNSRFKTNTSHENASINRNVNTLVLRLVGISIH